MIGYPGARYNYLDWVNRHNERFPLPPVSMTGRAEWTPKRVTAMARKLPKKDVVIIGLGWTGSIMANELTDEGLDVIAIERGPWRDAPTDFPPTYMQDELRYRVRHELFLRPDQTDLHLPQQDGPDRAADPQLGRLHAAERRRRRRRALERRDVALPAVRFRAEDASRRSATARRSCPRT